MRWAALALSLAATAFVAVPTSAYWLWVAESAFLGVREPADFRLGMTSVGMALVPVVAGATGWLLCGRQRDRRRVSRAASVLAVAAAASLVPAIAAAFARFPS